jgi:hypothetical protein
VDRYRVAGDGSTVDAIVSYGDFDEAARRIYPEVTVDPADALYLSEAAARAALASAKAVRHAVLRRVRAARR